MHNTNSVFLATDFIATVLFNAANVCNRKIKENEELEAATKLAQQEEMERLQRLQEIQEQVWQQAALDLRLHRQSQSTLVSPVSIEPPVIKLEPPAIKSEVSDVSPTTPLPPSLPNSSDAAGNYWSDGSSHLYICQ